MNTLIFCYLILASFMKIKSLEAEYNCNYQNKIHLELTSPYIYFIYLNQTNEI